jgi:hypothetical protein
LERSRVTSGAETALHAANNTAHSAVKYPALRLSPSSLR